QLWLGRGAECGFVLSDADASRRHAEIICDLDGATLRDLDSKNGTLVNGRVAGERRLQDRDEIRIGSTLLVYEDPAANMIRTLESEQDEAEEEEATESTSEENGPESGPLSSEPVQPMDGPLPSRASQAQGPNRREMDAFIYLFAGIVVLASLAGLYFLL